MNQLTNEKRKAVVAALVEGASINATVRMTGVSKPTILKLIRDLGAACAKLHDEKVRGLKPQRIQCDEIWSFIYCKQKRVVGAKAAPIGAGDCWTWTAIDSDTKLIMAYLIGLRTDANAAAFMLDLAGRVTTIAQLTTDGLAAYPPAVREAFGQDINYAQLIKVYRSDRPDRARYSPAECIGTRIEYVEGGPDPAHVSTSHVERSNLTIRMSIRRFTRLTNGHSKKLDNHGHAVALFFAYYNFCRRHASLNGQTPAMASGLAGGMRAVRKRSSSPSPAKSLAKN
jgi:IS1 family transposase